MKINILSSIGHKPGGLNRVLLSYAHNLSLGGHKVKVIKPLDPKYLSFKRPSHNQLNYFRMKAKELAYFLFRPPIRPYRCSWMECKAKLILVPSCQDEYIPEADFVIFSSAKLINSVAALDSPKGKKVMIVQDAPFAQNPSAIPKDITLIAVSSLVKELLSSKFPEHKIFLLVNGVNLSLFCNPRKVFRPAKVVGMIFYNRRPKHKGMEDGIAAFEITRNKYPHLELWMAGKKREKWLPPYVRFYKGFNQQMLTNFYRSTDIFLYPSQLDACPLPPMEAMACKCALVSTKVGGISDFTIPDKTALDSSPKYIEGLAKNLTSLVEDPERLKEIALAGYEKIKEFSWENQTQKLEEILLL